jgi:hypothetical protein
MAAMSADSTPRAAAVALANWDRIIAASHPPLRPAVEARRAAVEADAAGHRDESDALWQHALFVEGALEREDLPEQFTENESPSIGDTRSQHKLRPYYHQFREIMGEDMDARAQASDAEALHGRRSSGRRLPRRRRRPARRGR